jgi:Domain of unknown function (DUF4326)
MTSSKFVVHCRKWPYDVYIGRPSLGIRRDIPGSDGRWGNPFVVGKDGTREEVIVKHKAWLLSPENKELMNHLPELKGKVLGCWCAPLPCHGDTLSELALLGVSIDWLPREREYWGLWC